jgi:hypothetical protein
LTNALGDEFKLDGLGIHLLHASRCLVIVEFTNLIKQWGWVFVTRPQAFQVEDTNATHLAEGNGGCWGNHTIHGRRHEGKFKLVGIDLPRDVNIFGVAGATGWNNGDVVKAIGLSARLKDADLYL